MNREATWERTGTDIKSAGGISEALSLSGLDYFVEKVPLFLESGFAIPDKFATVKMNSNDVLGIVGNDYQVCQNIEAFDFVDYIEENIQFVKAGQTRTGIVYVIAKLPPQYVLGDETIPYVIFQNGHNGLVSIRTAISPLRVVCQNQFSLAFKGAENAISIRHLVSMETKMLAAREVLKSSLVYMDRLREEARELSAIRIDAPIADSLIVNYYPITEEMSVSQIARAHEKREKLLTNYLHSDDNQNFKGTAWGMINAYSDVITHDEPIRKSSNWEESRFMSVTLSPRLMMAFMNHVRSSI